MFISTLTTISKTQYKLNLSRKKDTLSLIIGKSQREAGLENADIFITTVYLSICLVFGLLALFSILLMSFLGWEWN